MIKKQSVAALVLSLLIPLVLALGGLLFSLINPEIAAGHPNYARNYHLLSLLKNMSFWASLACAAVLWLLVCLLVIRSRKRSSFWLFLAALGPFGFAILAMLNDKELAQPDIYTRFVQTMRWYVRVAYELCVFAVVCVFAYELMVLKRTLMVWFEAATTGVSTAQIINLQNASSGMWAFAEGNEVMFLAVLLYLLWPFAFRLIGNLVARNASAEKLPEETGL
jgi:hypothetical protein